MKKRTLISMVAVLTLSLTLSLSAQASSGVITKTQDSKVGMVDINVTAEGETTRPH